MMALFRYRVLTVSLAVLLVFSCLFMFLIPRVSATMVYSPYDITTYFIIMSGGTSDAAGSSYGYYYNGVYNTSSTSISSDMYASYADMYNSQLQAFWQYNQSSSGPHLGQTEGYTTYLDYIDACMQEAAYNSNNGSYMSYSYSANNNLQAHYEINPLTADLMFEFFKWQNVIDLQGSSIDAIDFTSSFTNVGSSFLLNGETLYDCSNGFTVYTIDPYSPGTPLTNGYYLQYVITGNVYCCQTAGTQTNLIICAPEAQTYTVAKYRSYDNTLVTNNYNTSAIKNGIYYRTLPANSSGNPRVFFLDHYFSERMPQASFYSLPEGSVLIDTSVSFTAQPDVQQMNFSWLQSYLDAVDASLEPGYDGAAPAKPVISYDLSGTGVSSTDTDTATSEAIAQDLMQNSGGDNLDVDTMYDDPPGGGGNDDDNDGDEDEFKDVIIPLFNLPLPSFDFSLSGIWYYVVRWVQSMSSWMSTMFGLWGILPPAMVYPIWGTAVVVIVVGIYRRFFM